jgi:NADH:ubiquinone oxidoreductase subunit 4 (subunit M)
MLGNLKTTFISKYSDLNLHELVINLNLTVINFILGLETNFIFDISVNSLSLFSK